MIGSEKPFAESILKEVSFHREALSKLSEEIRELVKDKSVPLEIRWELFRSFDSGDSVDLPNFPTILGIDDPLDLIYWEKNEPISIFRFIERIEENLYEHNNIYEEAIEYFNIPEDREPSEEELLYIIEHKYIQEFKEWVLDEFLYEFTCYW